MNTSSGSRDYGRFDELAEEFAERFRRGERPGLQEYVDRLPEMADEIREMFPALVAVEQAEGDAREEASPPPSAVPRLRQVGDYRILREVGRGGMGVVYEAEQVSLGRRVALKVLPGHVAGDRKALLRFRREAKAAARLHHTNIVPVFEVGRDGDVAFYAMQFIQGQGLDQVVDELRRLRDPDRKSAGNGAGGPGGHAKAATVSRNAGASSNGTGRFQLGRAAESLLHGRLATDGLEPLAGAPAAAVVLAATERFDSDATSGSYSGDAGREHPEARPAPDASSSAVLPGGAHVSEIDTSGRRQPFFRSVAQIGRQAAQGLAYAHARGIVHRDIKPSNLLLDTAGIVWIADFGLAKTDDDGLTATGDILGTLRYMAPERFRGEGDARADIYALGLTLYELLTLRPAYGSPDRLKLIERIKAEEPARPRSVDGHVPRDLETIVLKAIAKDPERRYPTARAMAEDLRRFLVDEPILARRSSAAERSWRWARRHPAIAILGGILTGVLVLATAGSLLAARRFRAQAEAQHTLAVASEAERRAAERARAEVTRANSELEASVRRESRINAELRTAHERSRRRFELALEAAGDFQSQATDELTLGEPRLSAFRRRLLGAVLGFYTKLQGALEGDPDPRARSDLATAYVGAARIRAEIGSVRDAVDAYRRALAIDEALIAGDSTDVGHRAALAETLLEASVPLEQTGRLEEAVQMSHRALATYETLSRADPGDLKLRSGLSEAVSRVGYFQARTGAMGASLESSRKAVQLSQEVVRAAPSDETYRSRLARQLAELGDRLLVTGRRPESLVAYARALEVRQRLADEHPDDRKLARALAASLSHVGFAHGAGGAFGEAMTFHRRALELREGLASAESSLVADRKGLAESLLNIGTLEVHAGRLLEAESLLRRALSLHEQILDEDPTVTNSLSDLAVVLHSFGDLQVRTGRASGGLATLRQAADLAGRATRSAPQDDIYRYILALIQDEIGRVEHQGGAPGRALEAHRMAVTLFEHLSKAEPENVNYRSSLARNLMACANLERPTSPAKAIASLDRAGLVMERFSTEDPHLRYDLAAEYARLVGPGTASPTGDFDPSRRLGASHALAALRRLIATGFRDRRRIEGDPAFDGLRAQPEFRLLMLDLGFPSEPFAP